MPASAVIDLIANDARFSQTINRVEARMKRLEQSFGRAAAAAKKMLLIGGVAVAGFLKLHAEQIRAEVKLQAVLRATGNAAGVSFEELKKYAGQLQNVTGVGDEATISMMSLLATFKHIKGDVFREAVKAILDMSEVMGTDLKSSALQVAKALNDPIQQLTFLRRSGISFNEEQQKLIKNLWKSGRQAEAQREILKELNNEFGNAAEAIGSSFVGAMRKAKSALGDIGEAIGSVFAEDIAKFAKSISDSKDDVIAWVQANKEAILGATKFTAKLALLTIGLHALSKAVVIATVTLKALNAALLFFSAHPVIAAITAIATLLTYLGYVAYSYYKTRKAARELTKEQEELAKATEEVAKAAEAEAAATEDATEAQKRKLRYPGKEARAKRRVARGMDIHKELALTREEILTFGMDEREATLAKFRARGATDEELKHLQTAYDRLDALERTKQIEDELLEIARKHGREAGERLKALDDEAKSIKDRLLSDKERLRIAEERLDVLVQTGRLSAEEAKRYRQLLAHERMRPAAIEEATGMYRRILSAAAGRRPMAISPEQQTAAAVKENVKETKRVVSETKKTADAMEEIKRQMTEIGRYGLKTTGMYA